MCNIIEILPSKLKGCITAPYSKSELHRVIICRVLAGEKNVAKEIPLDSISDDIQTTIDAVKNLSNGNFIFCNDSGSTLRFLIPVISALGLNKKFILNESLSKRPLSVYEKLLPQFGVNWKREKNSVTLSGKLQPGKFYLPGNISSQFISGLLFALPLQNETSEIILSTEIESKPYIDMTIKVLSHFGIDVQKSLTGWIVPGNQTYRLADYSFERDWSQAAFFLCASAIGNNVFLSNLNLNSFQGDKEIINILEMFGAKKIISGTKLGIKHNRLTAIDVDVSQCPDLAPIISIVAGLANGISCIKGVSRLEFKECNRLNAIIHLLTKMGVHVNRKKNSLLIEGRKNFDGCFVHGFNDHRIVMALSIAATRASAPLYISDAHGVSKSYPKFFDDYKKLGGKINVINHR